jgi:hypothetical protein
MWKKERERHNPNLAPQSLGRLVGQSVAKHGAPGKTLIRPVFIPAHLF